MCIKKPLNELRLEVLRVFSIILALKANKGQCRVDLLLEILCSTEQLFKETIMRKDIHPDYKDCKVTCACVTILLFNPQWKP